MHTATVVGKRMFIIGGCNQNKIPLSTVGIFHLGTLSKPDWSNLRYLSNMNSGTEYLTWEFIQATGDAPIVYGHCAEVFGSRIFVWGGFEFANQHRFADSNFIYVLDTGKI
jgi:hypothetical protein